MHTMLQCSDIPSDEEVSIACLSPLDPNDMTEKLEAKFLERSREIVAGYRLLIEPSRKGGFMGRSIELPRSYARGRTDQECLVNLRATLIEVVAALLKSNRVPPRPSESKLSEQVNIRLTPEEKLKAEQLAQSLGCRGLADYIRSLLMQQLRE